MIYLKKNIIYRIKSQAKIVRSKNYFMNRRLLIVDIAQLKNRRSARRHLDYMILFAKPPQKTRFCIEYLCKIAKNKAFMH